MVERKTFGSRCFDGLNYALLALISFVCIYPMWYVLVASLSDPIQFSQHLGAMLWTKGYSLKGYAIVLENPNVWTGYQNTIFYVGVGTAVRMLMTSVGAYVLSRKHFSLRKTLTLMVVFTMYFSGGMIPDFLLVQALGMYNSRWALVLPNAIAAWNLIILKTAFQQVPAELEESAELDGANDMTILYRIILPVVKATLAVMVLFYAVGEWNAWFNAMVYLRNRKLFPLQLFLREILISKSAGGNLVGGEMEISNLFMEDIVRYCTIIVATAPILCAYPFVQKYFVKGVMLGSLKG